VDVRNLNILIFFIIVILIALGLKFKPTLSFLGFMLLLALPLLFILKFPEVFSKTKTLAGIFIFGLMINAIIPAIISQIEEMRVGITLMSLLFLTMVLVPNIFATSLLIKTGVSKREIIAFYFWFFLSVGMAFLFISPIGNTTPNNPIMQNIPNKILLILSTIIIYLELTAIPSAFCLIYRYARIFLIFLPMPVVLGYALLFTLG